MHTYRPPKENRASTVLPCMLLLFCFTCIWASKVSDFIPTFVFQFVSVACVAVAIHIILRYSLSEHAYTVDSENKLLKVTKIMGKKNTLVAAVEFGDIRHIDKKVKRYSPKKIYKRSFKKYNFCSNIFPQNAYCLICKAEKQEFVMTIEADALLLGLINEQIKRRQALHPSSE